MVFWVLFIFEQGLQQTGVLCAKPYQGWTVSLKIEGAGCTLILIIYQCLDVSIGFFFFKKWAPNP